MRNLQAMDPDDLKDPDWERGVTAHGKIYLILFLISYLQILLVKLA